MLSEKINPCFSVPPKLPLIWKPSMYVLHTYYVLPCWMQNATAKKLIDHDFRERKSCRENNPLGHIGMPEAILIEASSISL